jgi:hypothetical protein
MRWVLSETRAFKGVLSAQEDYCAWIGARSTASVLLKARCKHMRACTDLDFKVSADHVRRSTAKTLEWSKKVLSETGKRGGKELSIVESTKNREKVCSLLHLTFTFTGHGHANYKISIGKASSQKGSGH